MQLPALGSRVSLRYRSGPGEHTDVIGVLEAVEPALLLRTKSDGVAEVAPETVVAVKEISYRPVRTSEIRALEHAAALAWPGLEQHWHDGWLLRAGCGVTSRANSAVPLDVSANLSALPGIVDWYAERGLAPLLLLPERVLPVRAAGIKPTRVMVTDICATDAVTGAGADLAPAPDADWLAGYPRDVPADLLTAVVDGAVTFASVAGAVGRGAVTAASAAPGAPLWLGIAAVHVDPGQRRRGRARQVCGALLNWGAEHGAQRAYVEVLEENAAAVALYTSMGFRLHHRHRYVEAAALLSPKMAPPNI